MRVAYHDGSFGVVAARCQRLIDRIGRHSVGRIDRIVVGVGAVGSSRIVLACKGHLIDNEYTVYTRTRAV